MGLEKVPQTLLKALSVNTPNQAFPWNYIIRQSKTQYNIGDYKCSERSRTPVQTTPTHEPRVFIDGHCFMDGNE